jgi:hypothetical protein
MSKNYIGVKWNKDLNKYYSIITRKGAKHHCGFHDTEKQAAIARDSTIIKHGLNVPLQVLKPLPK